MIGYPIPMEGKSKELTKKELIKQKQLAKKEIEAMAKKEEPNKGGIPRHKRMAEGKEIELKCGGMAKGGKASKAKGKK